MTQLLTLSSALQRATRICLGQTCTHTHTHIGWQTTKMGPLAGSRTEQDPSEVAGWRCFNPKCVPRGEKHPLFVVALHAGQCTVETAVSYRYPSEFIPGTASSSYLNSSSFPNWTVPSTTETIVETNHSRTQTANGTKRNETKQTTSQDSFFVCGWDRAPLANGSPDVANSGFSATFTLNVDGAASDSNERRKSIVTYGTEPTNARNSEPLIGASSKQEMSGKN